MIQIQLKDGKTYKTEVINFVTLGNVPCVDFWHTTGSGTRARDEVPISKIDTITSSTEETIKKLYKNIAEVVIEINSSIASLRDDLRATS
jgi:hypothetical protein